MENDRKEGKKWSIFPRFFVHFQFCGFFGLVHHQKSGIFSPTLKKNPSMSRIYFAWKVASNRLKIQSQPLGG